MKDEANPWTVLSSERVYEDAFISLIKHAVADASGKNSQYAVTHYKQLGLRILPIDRNGQTWLVGQYRFAAGAYSWELPAGGGDVGEPPQAAAARELHEEVGLEASSWLEINRLVPAGSMLALREISYLAWDLKESERDPDPQEVIQVRRVPFRDAVNMALTGEIANAGTVATILMAHCKALRGELPALVADRLR
jgi:ADP-ribose pyrophosphatase